MNKNSHSFFRALIILLGAISIFPAAASAQSPEVFYDDLDTSLTVFFTNENLGPNSKLSFVIGNAQTGEILLERNSSEGLQASSLSKLFTAAAVLDEFGAEHRFNTTVEARGQINEEGVLNGDLLVRGGGDPTLGPTLYGDTDSGIELLKLWSKDLKREYGLKRVSGTVIGDATRYYDDRTAIGWDLLERAHGNYAEVSALSYHQGRIDIMFDADRSPGKRPYADFFPDTKYIALENMAIVAYPESIPLGIALMRKEESRLHSCHGSLRQGTKRTIPTAIPDNALYTATLFESALNKEGIRLGGKPRSLYRSFEQTEPSEPLPTQILINHPSPMLGEIISYMMSNDQHFTAEVLGRELALKQFYPTQFQGAAQAIMDWAQKRDYKRNHFVMVDASGLSPFNKIPALSVYDLLLDWKGISPKQQAFQNALPVFNDHSRFFEYRGPGHKSDKRELPIGFKGIAATSINASVAAGYLQISANEELLIVIMIDQAISPQPTIDSMLQQIDYEFRFSQ